MRIFLIFSICLIFLMLSMILFADTTSTIITISLLVLGLIMYIIFDRFKNPFSYPKIQYPINISNRRQPSYEECIEEWIIDNRNKNLTKIFDEMVSSWTQDSEQYLKRTIFWRRHKKKLYESIKKQIHQNDYPSFEFVFYRNQIVYTQQNYQKYSHKVQCVEHTEYVTLNKLLAINNFLKEINYETTTQKYFANNQRKLMTQELRQKIIKRDNYTCQKCGKYMPDQVGIHVDHILAIKNGGKTVESNLQVLCDKCNLKKGAKINF